MENGLKQGKHGGKEGIKETLINILWKNRAIDSSGAWEMRSMERGKINFRDRIEKTDNVLD